MDVEAYSLAAEVEDEHWWFRGRRAILRSVLDRYIPSASRSRTILEVGCGNGGNLPLLSAYGHVLAVEKDDAARARASSRGVAHVERGWLPDGLPYAEDRFDLIAAFDVLEHVDEDGEAVRALRSRLTLNGLLIVTVPAFGWLWSRHDEFSHHKRRYTRAGLSALLTACGFGITYSSYFNTFLFPAAVAHMKLGPLLRVTPAQAMRIPPPPVNRALTAIFSFESAFIPRWSFPYGVSVLLCARPE